MAKTAQKAADRADAGREFITSLVGSFPEGDLRTKLAEMLTDEVLASADTAAAVAFAGDGALRKSEFSRTMDESRATLKTQTTENATLKGRLDTWYADNQAKLGQFDDMAAKVATLEAAAADPNLDPTSGLPVTQLPDGFDPAQYVRIADLETRDRAREADFLGFHRISQRLGLQHFSDFNEVLDEDQILRHPNIQKIGFEAAYQDIFKDQIAVRQTKIDDTAAATLKAEHRKEWDTEQQATAARPYPLGTEASDLGTLARLHEEQATQTNGSGSRVEAATKAYLEATSESQGGPPA